MTIIDRLSRFLRFVLPQRHVWKQERESNLGSYIDYGDQPEDICTMYRIAVYERCLLTDETRIRERCDYFPVRE